MRHEMWRDMTLMLMRAQQQRVEFGMYKSGLDSILVLLKAVTWVSSSGLDIEMQFNLAEGE